MHRGNSEIGAVVAPDWAAGLASPDEGGGLDSPPRAFAICRGPDTGDHGLPLSCL